MKLLHTADWHIGRTLNGFSLLEEQKFAFNQILAIAKKEKVDGIIIAGDLYDRSVPNVEAVTAFNNMLKKTVLEAGIPIYAITGNHDSAKRLEFGYDFFKQRNLYLHTSLDQALRPVETENVQLFLLPYLDPMDIRVYYKQVVGEDDETVRTYQKITDCLKRILIDIKKQFNPEKKQVLITHFAVTKKGAKHEEALRKQMTSEVTSTIGGLATLTSDLFNDFDYVALGHIHTHHASPTETIVYSGSPLVFNTKEAKMKSQKGVYVVDLTATGVSKKFFPLEVKKELIVIEESFITATNPQFFQQQPCHKAWFSFALTDYDRKAMTGINVRARLEEIYGKDIVEISIEENKNQKTAQMPQSDKQKHKELSPEIVVTNFYEAVREEQMTDYQGEIVESIMEAIKKEGN